jgi:hypothetical protein
MRSSHDERSGGVGGVIPGRACPGRGGRGHSAASLRRVSAMGTPLVLSSRHVGNEGAASKNRSQPQGGEGTARCTRALPAGGRGPADGVHTA